MPHNAKNHAWHISRGRAPHSRVLRDLLPGRVGLLLALRRDDGLLVDRGDELADLARARMREARLHLTMIHVSAQSTG